MDGDARPTLLCYDGSEHAAEAIARAGERLRAGPAVVVHAYRPLFMGAFRYAPDFELTAVMRQAATELDEAGAAEAHRLAAEGAGAARDAGFAPVDVRVAPVAHTVWETLLEVAAEVGAGTIVVGSHGRSGPRRAVLGGVAVALVHYAEQPVLVARRPRADRERAPRRGR